MCKAIEDLINDSKAEGITLGRNEGIAEGISRGRSEGITEGIAIGKINLMSELVNDNLLSIKDAAARVGMTEDAFTAMLRR